MANSVPPAGAGNTERIPARQRDLLPAAAAGVPEYRGSAGLECAEASPCVFSPDARLLARGGVGSVGIWSTASGEAQ